MVKHNSLFLILFSVFFSGCGFFPSTIDVGLEVANSSKDGEDSGDDLKESSVDFNGKKKADILFVVDTSYPMVEHLKRVDETFKNFIERLSPVSWKIAFTNADYDSKSFSYYGRDLFFGKVMQLELDGNILSHRFLYSFSKYGKKIFLDTLKRYEKGDVSRFSSEQYVNPCDLPPYCQGSVRSPIRSLMSAISINKGLIRKEAAAFIAVIFTNGDDVYIRDNMAGLFIDKFRKHYGPKKKIRVYSISIVPGEQSCLRQDQSAHYSFVGSAYSENIHKLVQNTGGKAMSICSPDYSPLASMIAHSL